ncbi:unnamed protein product [Urochloa humidicola]
MDGTKGLDFSRRGQDFAGNEARFRSLAELSRRLGSTFHGVRLDEPTTEQFTATLSGTSEGWAALMFVS